MRTRRFVVWLLLTLAVINFDAWDYSPWDVPQEQWFHHQLQWGPDGCMCDLTKETR